MLFFLLVVWFFVVCLGLVFVVVAVCCFEAGFLWVALALTL